MPFRRRRSNPIKTDKHEITWSNLGQNASTVQTVTLAKTVDVADKDAASDTSVGSHVRSIYFEFHFSPEVITSSKVIHWQIVGYQAGQTIGVPSLYYQDERAIIFKRGMEMLVKDVGTVYKRIFVVKVPRKFQRQVKNLSLFFRYICSSTETINACGIAIYKEQY